MAKHVKHIRFVTATSDAYKGHDGELTVDTSKKVVVVHDNAKTGGYPQAREDLSNVESATINIAGKMSVAQVIQLNEATADIVTNTADIATNAANIATNAADIIELQALNGVTETKTTPTYTVVAADQNKIIELNHATMVCTLDLIATIAAAVDVPSFRVTLRNINNADATIQVTAPNTMDVDAVGNSASMVLSKNQSITFGISTSQTNWMKLSSGASIGSAVSIEVYDAVVNNDLTVTGDTILGDNASDTITVNGEIIGDLIPDVDNTYVVGSTDKNWAEVHTHELYVKNGAQADLYYRDNATGLLIALPKGIAGQVLRMNAGATAPEWSNDASLFTSGEYPFSAITQNIPHGLGIIPLAVFPVVVCQTGEGGYSIGDQIPINPATNDSDEGSGASTHGLSISVNSTNIVWRMTDTSKITVAHKTTGAEFVLTAANWRIKFTALGEPVSPIGGGGTDGGMIYFSGVSVGTGASITQALVGTVEKIEINFSGISASSAGIPKIKLGSGGVLQSTGYVTSTFHSLGGDTDFTDGYGLVYGSSGATVDYKGQLFLTRLNGNVWIGTGMVRVNGVSSSHEFMIGQVTLAGPCDIVGMISGAGVFDGGTWRVGYQAS